ncbi:transposase [Pseudomonas aeruginosa]|uniref:transposase n=1 Tax=Pseudomonas aeruginosa TaxID=287 RepID=UPI003A101A52|nr:transposase [Pseudomonas aeruginosa]HCL3290476.1 transposase [Pseudomonas aeruginosa]
MEHIREYAEQIVLALQLAHDQRDVQAVCRQFQISRATFYRWRLRYGGLAADELVELWRLELENHKLRRGLQQIQLDRRILRLLIKRLGGRASEIRQS